MQYWNEYEKTISRQNVKIMDNPPSIPPSGDFLNYQNLQKTLDQVIGKLGLSKTIELLEGFIGNTSISANQTERIKLISAYITSQCISIFDLNDQAFFDSKITEYRDGRMACYHLFKKYTECSYAKIGEHFGQAKRNVMYYSNKCDEVLSVPQFYPVFIEKYNALEKCIIQFISRLNLS